MQIYKHTKFNFKQLIQATTVISVVMFLGDLLIEIMEEGRVTVAGLNTVVRGSFDNDDGGLFEIIQCATV